MTSTQQGNGNAEVFDDEWIEALKSGGLRWLSYPATRPLTQTELFERVKADQVDRVLDHYHIRSGTVLEYGCGSAGMSVYLANRRFNAIAADLSRNALQLAYQNAELHRAPVDCFKTLASDVFHLPLRDESCDVVMSYGLLEHFTEQALVELLRETNRVLRSGGVHIVDIVHGRVSMRSAANAVNFVGSSAAHLARGNVNQLSKSYQTYFENYFENKFPPNVWVRLFKESGLQNVTLHTCRPVPLLALSGQSDRVYTAALRACLPLWRWFDQANLPGLNALGWMYLVYGVKP